MSQLLIQQYLNQLETLKRVSGTQRESVVREAFKDLLKGWARSHDLDLRPGARDRHTAKERRYVDGALMHTLRVPFGYWEAKDDEGRPRRRDRARNSARGYPQDNIIFEDSSRGGPHPGQGRRSSVAPSTTSKTSKSSSILLRLRAAEIAEFRKAVEQFKDDLPDVLEALRSMIERAHEREPDFSKAAMNFSSTPRRRSTRASPRPTCARC